MTRKKRTMRGTAQARSPEVHHHQPKSWGVELLVLVPTLVALAVGVFWFLPVFLLERGLGLVDPAGWWALTLLALLVCGTVGSGLAWLWLALWGRKEKVLQEGRVRLAELELQKAREERMAASRPLGQDRMTGRDGRRAQVALAVLAVAYERVAQRGQYGPSDPLPWSKNNAPGTVCSDGSEVTYTEGQQVGAWLKEELGIVSGYELDLGRFPDLDSCRRELERRWGLPPVIRG